MHEQSETIEKDGKYINVYGHDLPNAGQQLPGTPEYGSLDEAVSAAVARSASGGGVHKYTGDPATEAEHIKQGMLRSKLNAAHNKLAVVSGSADAGIQAMKKINAPKLSGKYWGSNVSVNLNELPNILDRHMNMLDQQNGVSLEDQHNRLFNSGAFAEARKRQNDAFQVAMSNVNANDQEAAMLSGRNVGNTVVTPTQPLQVPKSGALPLNLNLPKGEALTEEQRIKKNFDLDAIERKMGIGVKPKNETEDEHLRRLGLK